VHRAVASDDDELRRTVGGRLCGQLAQMAGPLGEERVARQAEGGSAASQLGPATASGATGRSRIDEEDGARGANDRR